MKTITIEELEALKDAEKTIVDIRPQDQYMRGTFPGAVSLPASRLEEQYEEETARLDKMHPVYVMCHTGEKSQEWVRRLTGDGFDAVNVEGGYRAWLRLSLSRFVGGESEADREEKRARIEQSIIKKFRKPIWRQFTRAIQDLRADPGGRQDCSLHLRRKGFHADGQAVPGAETNMENSSLRPCVSGDESGLQCG